METFDQATRDQEIEANSSSTAMASHSGSTHSQQQQDQKRQRQEANSAVQLDRDVQQSRQVASESSKVGGLSSPFVLRYEKQD